MDNRMSPGSFAFVQIVLLAFMVAGCNSTPEKALKVGAMVPVMEFKTLDGGSLTTAQFKGKTVVLNFWATWCAPCRKEMPSLERLSRELDSDEYKILGVSLDIDQFLVREFALQYNLSFPLVMAPNVVALKQAFDLEAIPDTLIIAPDGRLADRILGTTDWDHETARRRVFKALGRWKQISQIPDRSNQSFIKVGI